MNGEPSSQRDLVDTTDCLEAVGVFRCWKNVFFTIALVCLILIQVCFWVADLGLVAEKGAQAVAEADPQQVQPAEQQAPPVEAGLQEVVDESAAIEEAARQVTQDANKPVGAQEAKTKKPLSFSINLRRVHLMWTIRTIDFVLIFAAVLYCLTILFTLKVSMVGRLGGINHIARALIMSLILVVLVMPWQEFFGWFVTGAIFTPSELMSWVDKYESATLLGKVLYYLRFTGYWVVAILLLIFAQIRTARWSRATLRRLEVV